MANIIEISTEINAPIQKVWDVFTKPQHIEQWNAAAPEWHTPKAINDLREGGIFSYRMEAKDGSMGFDFGGTFDKVEAPTTLEYTLGDGRKVTVNFAEANGKTTITENFEVETQNPEEMQKQGWQAILTNFKRYVEGLKD